MSRDARTRSSAHSPAFTSTTTTSTQNETTGKTIAGVGGRAQRQLVLPVRLGISASHHRLTVSPGNCGQPVEHLVSSMSSCRMCLKRLRDANAASAKSAEWFTATCHAQAPCAQDQILRGRPHGHHFSLKCKVGSAFDFTKWHLRLPYNVLKQRAVLFVCMRGPSTSSARPANFNLPTGRDLCQEFQHAQPDLVATRRDYNTSTAIHWMCTSAVCARACVVQLLALARPAT